MFARAVYLYPRATLQPYLRRAEESHFYVPRGYPREVLSVIAAVDCVPSSVTLSGLSLPSVGLWPGAKEKGRGGARVDDSATLGGAFLTIPCLSSRRTLRPTRRNGSGWLDAQRRTVDKLEKFQRALCPLHRMQKKIQWKG